MRKANRIDEKLISDIEKSMNWDSISFDWNHIRAFLATVETGSLSAAARALKQTQPTLSRQISLLEEALQLTLFERGTRNMRLTDAGTELLSYVQGMADAATQISRVAAGQSQAIEGSIRITSSDAMAAYALPPCLISLRQKHPGISVELVPSNEMSDLTRRDADIAIRHVRPEQPDLIARQLGDFRVGLFAASDYLDRVGRPRNLLEVADLDAQGVRNITRVTFSPNGKRVAVVGQRSPQHWDSTKKFLAKRSLGHPLLPEQKAKNWVEVV